MKTSFIRIAQFVLALALTATTSVAAEAPAFNTALANIEIDEINIIGVSVFESTDIEKLVEITPGDRLDRTKVVSTAKSLQDLYRSSGYEEVQIQTRLLQKTVAPKSPTSNVLEIAIVEGRPTRIASLDVIYDVPSWSRRLERLSEKIEVGPGDIFAREKLLNGYRSLQEALTGYDFLSSKVQDAVVETVSPQNLPFPKEVVDRTAKWVKLTVHVTLGDRVSFTYRGNTVFTNGQLSAWIDEQRLLGFSQDYIDRLKNRFEDEYRKLGYDKISIQVYTFEDHEDQRKNVSYVFDEGPRVELAGVGFDGNSVFTTPQLVDQFGDFATPALSRGYYVAKDVQKTAEVLIEWMKSQGYLAAKLVSISRTYRPRGNKVDVVIYVYEGEQTITEAVRLNGLSVLTLDEAQKILGVAPGTPLNLYALNEGLEVLKARYRDLGYLDFVIRNEGTPKIVQYSQENHIAEVVLDLEEGTQYRVSRIEIEGLRKTKSETVLRELLIQEGEVLSERDWLRSEARLRRLGIFANASIKAGVDPDRKDGKIMKVYVEEGSPGLIAGGVGLRNDLGGRVFGQIQYANLWGRNHTALLSGTANRRFKNLGAEFCASTRQTLEGGNTDHCFIEYDLSLGYVWPWFGLGDTTFRPRISLDKTQYKQFDANTQAFEASWERSLFRNWGLTGVLTYSLELVEQYDANVADDDRRLRIGSITPTLILDRRDNPLAPSKGTYTTLQWDLSRPQLGSQNSPADGDPPVAYWRFQGRSDLYVPLPKGIEAYFSFRTGLEYNLAKPPEGATAAETSRYAIPLIKQFTLGGVGSLRGFKEQSLFVPDDVAVGGSLTYVNYRAQVDFPFAGNMKFGPFLDAANLKVDDYSLGGLRYGAGAGLHYKSPVGPVNFDFGVNVKPKPGEDGFRIHFSIGNI